jgi:hypothetical protein|tara:strand:- start:83 stop:262 length:180 start_codon:yes stop_codon:yes gene_type:complete
MDERHLAVVWRAYKYLVNLAEGMMTDDEVLFSLVDDLENVPGVYREEDDNERTADLHTE